MRALRPIKPHVPAPTSPVKTEAPTVRSDASERFTFFYAGPFSQWHGCRFQDPEDGTVYNKAEQYMMGQKAILFRDHVRFREIMETSDPKKQQALGKLVTPFDEATWLREAKAIVKRGNRLKFSQSGYLLDLLLEAEGTTLVEASPRDRLWGIGVRANDPRAGSRDTWLGKNWLGEVLTELCEEFVAELRPGRRP